MDRGFRLRQIPGVVGITVPGLGSKRILSQPFDKVVMTVAEMEQAAALSRGTRGGLRGRDSAVSSETTMQLDFSRAGRSETVGGIRCEVWRGSAAREGERIEGEVCLADGVGLALPEALLSLPTLTGGRAAGPRLARYRRAFGTRGMIKTITMEATRVERKRVSAATFRSPRGYTEVAVGAVLQQLQEQLRKADQRRGQRARAAARGTDSL